MHLFTSSSNVTYYIANSAVQVVKPDKYGVSSGQQRLKYQFMMTQTEKRTQTEKECINCCRTGDNKCL